LQLRTKRTANSRRPGADMVWYNKRPHPEADSFVANAPYRAGGRLTSISFRRRGRVSPARHSARRIRHTGRIMLHCTSEKFNRQSTNSNRALEEFNKGANWAYLGDKYCIAQGLGAVTASVAAVNRPKRRSARHKVALHPHHPRTEQEASRVGRGNWPALGLVIKCRPVEG
jgi:hypothetical protein